MLTVHFPPSPPSSPLRMRHVLFVLAAMSGDINLKAEVMAP